MKRMRIMRLSLLTAAIILLSFPAFAQSTATIQGTVVDTQNAPIPGATIVITNTATGLSRTIVTDASGTYVAASLPPGEYRIEVSLAGFTTQTRTIPLEVSQTRAVDVQLGVAALTEAVNVTAATPVIDTTTASVGTVVTQRTVQEIPLNGRHFVDLGLLVPGSVTPPQNGFLSAPLRGQGSFAFNTAGNREDTVNFMVNGINLNDMVQNQITFQPSINTVQEFKVDNSTFSAEYGRNSGAIVNIATRSGTNNFSGEAFEFYRNDRFDSRNAFNIPPARKSPFNRNQFGAALGGPIVRNKVFFFGTYEGLRQRQGVDINSGVLSEADRAAVTDPISKQLLQYIPTSNAVVAGAARFVGSATAPVNIDQWTGDLSGNAGASNTIHGYYAFQKDLRQEPTLALNTIPNFGDTRHSHRQIGTFNETHIFSQRLINEARLGFNRIAITFEPNAKIDPTSVGINDGISRPIGLPQITVNGVGLNFGGPSGEPNGRTDTTLVYSDTATLSKGAHEFQFGGEYRHFRNVNFTSDTGQFTFPSLAAFQTGLGNNFSITLGDRPSDIRVNAYGLFARDSYKLAPNLTLDLGLRVDSNMSPKDTQNRFVVFDASTASLVRVGSGIDRTYKNSNDVSPRVGVIWDPTHDGRTAVRAAYARMIDQPVTNAVTNLASNPPLAVPLTFAGNVTLANAAATATAGGLAPFSINPNFTGGHMQSWNVNVERQLFPATSVMVGYFGSKGSDLRVPLNINQFVNGVRPFPRVAASSAILPGTALGNITEIDSTGASHYKGLWVSGTQRLSHGLQFDASYTLSKSTDYNSLSENTVRVQDSFHPERDLAPSDYDARHRFVINTIYELPFHGNGLVEGWQVGGIVQAQTGNPLNIVTNVSTFNGVVNTLRPDLVGSLTTIGDPNQWFSNTVCNPSIAGSCTSSSVFAIPVAADGTTFHFGNLPRNAVYGPGFKNTDLSITKNTGVGGNRRIQLRIEVFNLFNTANYGQPGRIVTVGSTSFGVITNTRFPTGDSGSSRQVQFAAKYLF